MKVSLQVHKPIVFNGNAGTNFVKKHLTKPVRCQRKTSEIMDLIKEDFKIKSSSAEDIIEALVEKVRTLNLCCESAEKKIEKLMSENDRLGFVNGLNSYELEEKENKIQSLRYKNFLLKK